MQHAVLRLAVATGLALLSFTCSKPLAAATLRVVDLGDSGQPGQLRALINAAAPGDTILIPAGTIVLSGAPGEDRNAGGDLDLVKNLTIQGSGAGVTIIDGGAVDGVFDILAGRSVAIAGVTIQNGSSAQAGGGGLRNYGTLNLSDAIVSGNAAHRPHGGGEFNYGGGIRNLSVLNLNNVAITNNLSEGDGGGIYNERGATMTLADVTVSANRADRGGGGILNFGAATLTSVTISGNNADTDGGGMLSGGGGASAALTNVTVSGNRANGSGGGIFNSATLSLTNVTVTANTANSSGGGFSSFGSAALRNVILAGNTDVGVSGTANCAGTNTSQGHNLDSGATCGLAQPGDLSNTNPLLGPLQNNGGRTFTHALLPGSPAIDAGTNAGCPATDQRGVLRGPIYDIGAYEAAGGATPSLSANGIVNGATFRPGIAPGSFVTIYGRNLTDREYWWDSAIPDGRTLPTSLGGVRVRINAKDCFVNYASPNQLNVLAPPDSAAGNVPVEVFAGGQAMTASASLAQYSPGFFSYTLGGKLYPAVLFANTAIYVAPAGALPGVTSRPARPGDYLQLYATGLGATNPPYAVGQVLARPYPIADLSQVQVTIGGIPASVLYAGMTFAGVFQVNVQVPAGIGAGDLPIVLTFAGLSTQPNAVLAFER